MTYLTLLSALGGGALIGLAAALLLFFNNRTAGISGIAAGILPPWRQDIGWRVWFLAGLVLSAPLWTLLGGRVHSQIDAKLLTGSAIFGIGWGLSGFCPGPALISLTSGLAGGYVFVGAMFIGFFLFNRLHRGR